eukprot:scpid72426/ scgid29093/ 
MVPSQAESLQTDSRSATLDYADSIYSVSRLITGTDRKRRQPRATSRNCRFWLHRRGAAVFSRTVPITLTPLHAHKRTRNSRTIHMHKNGADSRQPGEETTQIFRKKVTNKRQMARYCR